jgi:hypothetical protein
MIRKLPAVQSGLRMRITERERQQADIYIKDTPHALRVDRQLADLRRTVARLSSPDGIELAEEGTGSVGRIYYNGTTGVTARRIR